MRAVQIILIGCLYLVSYVAFFLALYAYMPEREIWEALRKYYNGVLGGEVWDEIWVKLLLSLALIANCLFIYLTFKLKLKFCKILSPPLDAS